MKRKTRLILLLAALLGAGTLQAMAGDGAASDISLAEQKVFEAHHLANLPTDAVLHYDYRSRETGQSPLGDDVTLTLHTEGERGRVVTVDYLHGEHHLALPDVEHAESNPVILYFLEQDVRDMHKRLGGVENYFRKRIRMALAEHAKVRPVQLHYAGHAVSGTEVVVQPYLGDPMKDRFKGMDGKSYILTLSDEVPGGVYELRTLVDDPHKAGTPMLENTLTLTDKK